ncbi:hypothetical protein C5167_028932, partial [Papaver somniferum]
MQFCAPKTGALPRSSTLRFLLYMERGACNNPSTLPSLNIPAASKAIEGEKERTLLVNGAAVMITELARQCLHYLQ